jgi:hypothetical protein
MNHFSTFALKFRVWSGDRWSRLLVIYYFLDLAKKHLGIEFFQLGTTLERPHVVFGRVLTFREQLLSSDYAAQAVDYHGQPIGDIVTRKVAEAYPGWSHHMEPVDLDVPHSDANT